MKKVFSFGKFLALLMCIIMVPHQSAYAQCDVASGGSATNPSCNYQTVSGGAGEYWTLNVQSGVNYSFYWSPSGCPDNTAFCVNGTTSTATSAAPYTVTAPGSGGWDIGFYEGNTTWCGGSATLAYKITTPTATAGATSSGNVCGTASTFAVPSGFGSSGIGTISWASSGDGTFAGGSGYTPTYSLGYNDQTIGGVVTLTMTVNNGGCKATAAFDLTVNLIPAATPGTITSETVCGATDSLKIPAGYTATNGTISWSTSGDGTFTRNAATATPTYTFGTHDKATGGVITLTMTVSSGSCTPASVPFDLTIIPAPIAIAGSTHTATVCTTTDSFTVPTGYSFANGTVSWFSSGDGNFTTRADTTTPTYVFGINDAAIGGAITLTMSVSDGGSCPPATASFVLNLDPLPEAMAGVVTSATVCASINHYTVPSGYSGLYGTISWTTADSGTFSGGSTATPTYTFSGYDKNIGDVNTLTMIVSDGGTCPPDSAVFDLTIKPAPAITSVVSNPATVCATADSFTVPAGFGAAHGSITWTSSGDGVFDGGDTTTTPTYVFGDNDTSVGGGLIFIMRVSDGGTCTTALAVYDVTIDLAPTAAAGPITSDTVCANTLNYTIPIGYSSDNGNVSWTTSGNGTFSNITSTSPTYNFGSADMSNGGPVTLTMVVTDGPCTPATATFILHIHALPTATPGATRTATTCASVDTFAIPAGYTASHGGISWASSGDGTFTRNITTTKPTYTFGHNDSTNGGTITLTMTVSDHGICPSATATFALTIDPTPTATAGSKTTDTLCANALAYMIPAGYAYTNGTVSWTSSGNGSFTNINSTTPTYTFGTTDMSAGGVITLTMKVSNGPCTPATATFALTIKPLPLAGAGATTSATACATVDTFAIPAGYTSANGTISWASTGDGIFTRGGATTRPTYTFGPNDSATGGVITLTMTVADGGVCPPATASFALTIDPAPIAAAGSKHNDTACANALSYTIPAGYTATNGTISWTTSGSGTFTNVNSTTPTYAFGATDTTGGPVITLTMKVSNGPCTPATATFALTIKPLPAATPGATTTATVCASADTFAIPAGYTSANGSISWASTGDGTFTRGGTTTAPTYTFGSADIASGGIITLTMTVADGGICPSASTTFVLTIDPVPTAASVGPTQNICASLTSAALGGNTPLIGTGAWSQKSGPGTSTFSSGGSGSSTATASIVGTYVYTWTISNGVCASSSASDTVHYYARPTIATAGPTQNLCAVLTTAPLGGNTPAVGTGLWSQTSGPGTSTFSSATSGASTATASIPGTYVYTWTISNGTCPPSTAIVTVNYYATPTTATVGPTQRVCSLTSAALAGDTALIGTGAWSQASGPGTTTFSSGTSGSSTATASVAGIYVYTWTISNGTCPPSTANDSIFFYATPTTAIVGPTQNVCASLTSAPLGGNAPLIGTGAWSQTSGPGTSTFSAGTSGASTATASVTGTYVYTWTISNGVCPPSTASDTVNYYATPTTATVGPTQDLCASLVSAPLGGDTPLIGVGVWSQTSGPGSTVFSADSSGSSIATASAAGTYVYTWTITNGTCPPSIASDSVNYYALPTIATVGPTQSICQLVSDPLGGNTPVAGTGMWSQTSGPGTTTFSSSSSGSSTATASVPGVYVYTWTISNGNCTPTAASDSVFFYAIPTTASVGPTQDICASLTSASLGGDTPSIGSGLWSQTSGPGASTFVNDTAGGTTVTVTLPGTYVYTWTISNGACTSSAASDSVNYYALPTIATVGPTQQICGLTSNPLGGNAPTIGAGAWSQASGPGTTTFSNASSGSSTATASVAGVYVYTWTISNGNCTPTTASDSVFFYASPTTASVGPTQDICASRTSNALGGNTPAIGTGVWSQTSGPGTSTFSAPTSGSSTASASTVGTYVYTWTITSGVCTPSTASDSVSYFSLPTPATVGPNQSVCSLTSGPLGGNTPVIGTGSWSQVSGPGTSTFSSASSGSSTATASVQGSYIYTWTITNGNCPPSTANDTVTYYDNPTPATTGPTQNICGSLSTASLGGNTPAIGTGLWAQTSGPGTTTFSAPLSGSSSATASVAGAYVYTWTITNGVCPPSVAVDTAHYILSPSGGGSIGYISFCSAVGSGTLTVTGVTNVTQYFWSIPASLSGFSSTASILISGSTPGLYTVTVTPIDVAYGTFCPGTPPISGNITILPSPAITSVNAGSLPCYGINNDTITISATPGSGLLYYSIDSGTTYSTSATFGGLGDGSYNVIVKDDSNCTAAYANNTIHIQSPPQITVTLNSAVNVLCYGDSTGSINLTASGGDPAYVYSWSDGANTADLSSLPAGTYSLTVTDNNNCTVADTIKIAQNPALLLTATLSNILCPPLHNGRIDLPAAGGVPPYSYNWSNGSTAADLSGLTIGTYTATVTDSVGCTIDTAFTIINDSAFSITVKPDTITINEGDNTQLAIETRSNGARQPEYITWTPAAGLSCADCLDPVAAPVVTTQYMISAISDSGCVANTQMTITVNPQREMYVPNAFSPNGDGINDTWEAFGYKKAWVLCHVEVFDRWGEKVFESEDIDFGWDGSYRGSPEPVGVYVYEITVVFVDNYTVHNKGTITIIK